MFAMRPAASVDTPAIAAVINSRSTWLEERDMPTWRDSADNLAAQAGNSHGAMWVLEDHNNSRIIGCTTVQEQTPPWGWTPEELAEPVYYLFTTVTDPAHREVKPGTLIALWGVDHAARRGKEWVRRGCMFPGLVRYYETQGFTLLHEVQRTHHRVCLMARRAERLPELETLFTDPSLVTAFSSRLPPPRP
ncbi:GNAT family N-acetyltransferase [Streptomyces albofaciens JCM 4342]|uniref:GNAT family N-acetyltransferase n=1 Tax=Streptomyces albofaciens TaxID=66866 RepID=UPI000A4DD85D|nr:GNAT family N-acetyltransferase [Streptomyces albofaciens]KAA6212084.1 GNAT family N-acetyltransferase [Streptomyces albofaciens JCM 4342]